MKRCKLTNRDIVEKLRSLIKEIQTRDQALTQDGPLLSARDSLSPGGNFAEPSSVQSEFSNRQSAARDMYPAKKAEVIRKDGFSILSTSYGAGSLPWFYEPPLDSVLLLAGEERLANSSGLTNPGQMLFLDLETTGLSGAGTVAFLAGLGRWEKGEFEVRQFFLNERDCEAVMLEAIAEEIKDSLVLVTFNGKAFDVPVIRSRFIISGLIKDFNEFSCHIDLFSLIRKLGRHPVYGLSLKESVKRFIGVSRMNDIPGNMIPALYFIYEQDKDVSVLDQVFEHNRMDILDMVGLLRVLGQVFSGQYRPYGDPSALSGVGRFHLNRGDLDLARQCLGTSLGWLGEASGSNEKRSRDMRLLATVMRKQGDWDAAAGIWNDLIGEGGVVPYDYLWLARYYEICHKDVAKALGLVKECIALLQERQYPIPDALLSRSRRLEKIVSKKSASG